MKKTIILPFLCLWLDPSGGALASNIPSMFLPKTDLLCHPDVLIGPPPELSNFAKEALTLKNLDLIESQQYLKGQGYRGVFINGLDATQRHLRLANTLRQVRIHPWTTHVPAFARRIDSYIRFIEKGLLDEQISSTVLETASDQRERLEDRRERLEILEKFKAEAERAKHAERVTYRYLVNLAYRLAILATPQRHRTKQQLRRLKTLTELLEIGQQEMERDFGLSAIFAIGDTNEWETNTALEAMYSLFPRSPDSEIRHLGHLLDLFPGVIVLPVISDLGPFAFNRTSHTGVYLLGLVNRPTPADGRTMPPQDYIEHDIRHTIDMVEALYDRDIQTARRLNHFHNAFIYDAVQDFPEDQRERRERLEMIYYEINHESPKTMDDVFAHLQNRQRGRAVEAIDQHIFRTLRDPVRSAEETSYFYRTFRRYAPPHVQSQDGVVHFLQESIHDFVDVALRVSID